MGMSGEARGQSWRVMNASILLLFLFTLSACDAINIERSNSPTDAPDQEKETGGITIIVKDADGKPVKTGAVARVVGADNADDEKDGVLKLNPCLPGQNISVWASGYFISTQPCNVAANQYNFTLTRINTNSNPSYVWTPASGSASSCSVCHASTQMEWGQSGHARVFSKLHFETMYFGSNRAGVFTNTPTTRVVINDDLALNAPLFDPNYHGPGYKLDFPSANGNCAFCHAPAAVTSEQMEVNPFAQTSSAIREGLTCDICHKVLNVELNKEGYPHETRPGVLSLEYLLPPDVSQFYIGPSIDVDASNPEPRMTCSTILGKSEFCAACHYGKFYGVVIYGSYSEWKDSNYGRGPSWSSYRTCQDCHMSYSETEAAVGKGACSAQGTPNQSYNHNVMHVSTNEDGKSVSKMIESAAKVEVGFGYDPLNKDWLTVIPGVTSVNVGHRFPTDSPLRHLILVVEAWDDRGTPLIQTAGERIPNWAGIGDATAPPPAPNILNYGGLPGKVYANLLVESDTNVAPTVAYWNEVKYAWIGNLQNNRYDYSDSRLRPGITDTSSYSFTPPEIGNIKVRVKLIYRFAFKNIMLQKGWLDRPDIQVAVVECEGPPTDLVSIKCQRIE